MVRECLNLLKMLLENDKVLILVLVLLIIIASKV